MNKFFRRHRSHGSATSAQNVPESAPTDRKHSQGSDFVFERPGLPTSPPASADSSSLYLISRRTHTERSPSPGRRNRTLGLELIYQPPEAPCADIVLIHGLGGDSRKTWSKGHNPDLFWPGLWLPYEPNLDQTRIFTFGYNANFRPGEAKTVANVTDFAKELLFELRFSKSEDGESYRIGGIPLIFVVHSMGGLLAKKAYLLGQNDEHYKDLIQSITAIIFLSTPHRGSNLAEVLNRILQASLQAPRHFITDLNRGSSALEEINEQFRHVAPKLSIWSFYETSPTSVGPKKMMVLEKDSAILGYAGEISRPLYADHHGVCKFSSRDDVNYVNVRNALASLVEEAAHKASTSAEQHADEYQTLQELLSWSFDPDEDLDKHNRLRIEGTCEWISQQDGINEWLGAPAGSHLVWFGAAPASGKSVLSAYLVTHLRQRDLVPQYFFFNFGDQHKRSVANLLRSVACQIAKNNRRFRHGLLDLSKQGLRLDKADASLLWHKVYEGLLFKLDIRQPLFWIIDALDESDTPKLFLELIRACSNSKVSIRIFLTSRQTDTIQMGINKAARALKITKFEKQSSSYNANDIQRLVEQEVGHMRGGEEFKARVIQKIITRAEGNFLWTRLVLEEIIYCHTESAVEETLDELPSDMYDMYHRIEQSILNLPRKSNRLLAKALLQWTIGARRPMSLDELSQALQPEFGEILDLKGTISDMCGQFIRVDAFDHVMMIHHSAREYLIRPRDSELYIDTKANHELLCIKTITALLETRVTPEMIENISAQPFLLYIATSWSYHLKQSGSSSGTILDVLLKFFKSRVFPFWVFVLSTTKHLDVLIKASKSLSAFTSLVKKRNANVNPMLHRLFDLQLIDQWSIDLVKIVGKFSSSLLKHPQAIYSLISPFTPTTSALYQQQFCKNDRAINIPAGLDVGWTDRLARFSLPEGCDPYKMACGGKHIAILGVNGRVFLWDNQAFINIHVIEHGEPVTSIAFNAQGDRLVSYGTQTTKLWAIPSGENLRTLKSAGEARAITLFFSNDDVRMLAGFDDRTVRCFDLEDNDSEWGYVHADLFKESLTAEAGANSPTCVAFSKDGAYAGVAYRGFPLSVWSLESGQCISRCNRVQGIEFAADKYSAGWYVVWRFAWNPVTNHVIGFYTDGFVFKWHPLTGEHQEAQAFANDVVASSDGKLFLSSTTNGTIKVWDFAYFTVIYQLSSQDLLMGMFFSPDCMRFYDLRCGMVNSVNVWEPNSLLRFSDTEENISDLASEAAVSMSVAQASEAFLGQLEEVTAIASCPNGRYFCVGNDDGLVELRSTSQEAEPIEVGKFTTFMNVSYITWSQDARHLAAADLGGSIIIRSIEVANPARLSETTRISRALNPKLNLREQAISEILFNLDSSLLLVVTNQSVNVWSIKASGVQASVKLADGNTRKWINHPTHVDLLLGVGSHDIRVFSWQDLYECGKPVAYQHTSTAEQANLPLIRSDDGVGVITDSLERTNLQAETAPESIRAMVTQDLRYVLVKLSSNNSFIGTGRIFLFRLSELEHIVAGNTTQSGGTVAIKTTHIPDEVRSQVKIALGVLPGDRFVFLDNDLWLCTYQIDIFSTKKPPGFQNNNVSSIPSRPPLHDGDHNELFQRHYFIPDDWAMGQSLDLCCMTEKGTLLYPRDDKVSIIKADLSVPAFRRGSSAF